MGILNLFEILKCLSVIPKEFFAFLKGLKVMKEIKKIKASHDYSWLNDYLKRIDVLRNIILSYQTDDLKAEVPIMAFSEFDKDMLQLYFYEILLSHSVKNSFIGNTYVFELTPNYIEQN